MLEFLNNLTSNALGGVIASIITAILFAIGPIQNCLATRPKRSGEGRPPGGGSRPTEPLSVRSGADVHVGVPQTQNVVSAQNDHGSQAVVTGVTGSVSVQQNVHNDSRMIINQNLRASAGYVDSGRRSNSDEEWVKVAGIVLATLVVAVGFGKFFQPIIAAVIAAAVALIICATVLAVVSIRRKVFSRAAGVAVLKSVMALTSTLVLTLYVYAWTWEGHSMLSVQKVLAKAIQSNSTDDGLIAWVASRTIEPGLQLFKEDPKLLILCLLGVAGLVLSVAIDIVAIRTLWGWHAYLRMESGSVTAERVTKRAKTFSEQKWLRDGWRSVVVAVIVAVVLFAFPAYLSMVESGALSGMLFGQ